MDEFVMIGREESDAEVFDFLFIDRDDRLGWIKECFREIRDISLELRPQDVLDLMRVEFPTMFDEI